MTNKKLKTLKDFTSSYLEDDGTYSRYDLVNYKDLQDAARKWIKSLKKQRVLHADWVNRGIGENPDFDYPKGFNEDIMSVFPYGYDEQIAWIKKFFNL